MSRTFRLRRQKSRFILARQHMHIKVVDARMGLDHKWLQYGQITLASLVVAPTGDPYSFREDGQRHGYVDRWHLPYALSEKRLARLKIQPSHGNIDYENAYDEMQRFMFKRALMRIDRMMQTYRTYTLGTPGGAPKRANIHRLLDPGGAPKRADMHRLLDGRPVLPISKLVAGRTSRYSIYTTGFVTKKPDSLYRNRFMHMRGCNYENSFDAFEYEEKCARATRRKTSK